MTIKDLYEIAKEQGCENSSLYIHITNDSTGKEIFSDVDKRDIAFNRRTAVIAPELHCDCVGNLSRIKQSVEENCDFIPERDVDFDANAVKQYIKTSIFDENGFEKSLLEQTQNKGDKTNE